MITIWKYKLAITDKQSIEMPSGAELLSIKVQRGIPVLYAKVDTDNPPEVRLFEIFGTGHMINTEYYNVEMSFLGTFSYDNGNLMFHVFEAKPSNSPKSEQ